MYDVYSFICKESVLASKIQLTCRLQFIRPLLSLGEPHVVNTINHDRQEIQIHDIHEDAWPLSSQRQSK